MNDEEISLTGIDLLSRPLLNKGTAFTEEERDTFGLHGLLPPHVGTLDQQVARRLRAFRACDNPLERYAFLRDLQDVNETLFYALVTRNMEELLPIVYTPTVGEGCQRFSEVWRRPRGLFLSYPNRKRFDEMFASPRLDATEVIVVSDGERILGLGDQGAGGMGIPIGKLSLYTACAGINPEHTLPILLDVGTDNQDRLGDPLYVGWRSPRVRGDAYDAFVDTFVAAVERRWPHVLLQWEDFANQNAGRLLDRYRDRLCTFNDDIQGTAAVAAGTLLAAIGVTGVPLVEQRVALVGAGSAGIGIASLIVRAMVEGGLPEAEARRRFFAIDKDGLLVEGMPGIRPAQAPFAQPREAVASWGVSGAITLADVARHAHPTALIGVSGQPGAFSEEAVRTMAEHCARPVIFPLSNPTSRAEAVPADLMTWTGGRALVGTGSPFPGVTQTNNSYIFPGVGLGVLAARARRVTDAMFTASARALAALSPARPGAAAGAYVALLPPVDQLRHVAVAVATAVARQAIADGCADPLSDDELSARIGAEMWEPVYRRYVTPRRPGSPARP
jgi:malate dehydrogenase (oxaloacetate-decarboxylating)